MKARQSRFMVLCCAVVALSLTCDYTDDELLTSEDVAAITTFTSTAVAQHSARCMDVFGAQTGNDVNLIQWNCHGGANQSFTFVPVAGTTDTYNINTFTAGKCVEVVGASTADNARVAQNTCGTGTNQRFRLVPVTIAGTDKTFNIQAVHSSKCIGANGGVVDNGATLGQVPC